jgi:hypothetical protein
VLREDLICELKQQELISLLLDPSTDKAGAQELELMQDA